MDYGRWLEIFFSSSIHGNSSANASVKLPATENEVIDKTPKSTVQRGLKSMSCVNKVGKFQEDVSR